MSVEFPNPRPINFSRLVVLVRILSSLTCESYQTIPGRFESRRQIVGLGLYGENGTFHALSPSVYVNRMLSPREAAKAIGVSESSLKRWCDQGVIDTVRTVGGHRKVPISNLIRFIRERNQPILRRDILGLPARKEGSELPLDQGGTILAESLLTGDESLARQVIFDFYLNKNSISTIFDDVVCPAFREIGHRWENQTAEIYQERRSCEILQRILFELRRMQRDPDLAWTACGGTFEGDEYSLPTTMVELVLRDAGWNATSLGSSIPAQSMKTAIFETRPKLFWVCASSISNMETFVSEFKSLWQTAQATGTAVVIGGRGFTADVRERLTYCCYCDTMQQLEAFAKSMRQLASAHQA